MFIYLMNKCSKVNDSFIRWSWEMQAMERFLLHEHLATCHFIDNSISYEQKGFEFIRNSFSKERFEFRLQTCGKYTKLNPSWIQWIYFWVNTCEICNAHDLLSVISIYYHIHNIVRWKTLHLLSNRNIKKKLKHWQALCLQFVGHIWE